MTHPYTTLPPTQFWRTAIAERSAFEVEGLWTPKFAITQDMKIATAGSCFAQHFSRALVARGYTWKNYEPGPSLLTEQQAADYHFRTFSFRTGNIYTPKMLLQWLMWSFEREEPPQEVWEKDGRFYDPLRPTIEPGGFETAEEVMSARQSTFAGIRDAVMQSDVFVFTMGLTESWRDKQSSIEYAICPGTVAGTFDPERHEFHNHGYSDLSADMSKAIRFMARRNRKLRILLTVSPVPLTATASNDHVLLATSRSKALLRAVAADIVDRYPSVDYFPSFEIVTSPVFRGMFFAPNMRSVVKSGVDFIMETFFRDQTRCFGTADASTATAEAASEGAPTAGSEMEMETEEDIRCEEELLSAFQRR